MPKAAKPPTAIDFEAAMGELETLVEKLEQGEFTLEESLAGFARGMELTRLCQQALQAAEQKVQALTQASGSETLQDFTPPEDA